MLATGDQKRLLTLEAKITRKLSEIDLLSKCRQHRWSEEGTVVMDQSYEKTARMNELKEKLAEQLYGMREDFGLSSDYWLKTISVDDDIMIRKKETTVYTHHERMNKDETARALQQIRKVTETADLTIAKLVKETSYDPTLKLLRQAKRST